MDLKDPVNIVIIGRKKSGKTNLVKHLILRNTLVNDHFKYGLIFTNTGFNDEYNYVPPDYVIKGYDREKFLQYIKFLEGLDEIQPNYLVFEDLVGILNNDPVFTNFICNNRHYKTTVIVNAQYLVKGINTVLRENTDIGFFFNSLNDRTQRSLYEAYGGLFPKFIYFKEAFLTNTSERYTCMLYKSDGVLGSKGTVEALNKTFFRYKAPDMSKVQVKLEY